jgi:hypothetical protein
MKIQILFTFLLISSILSLTADDSILSAKYIVFLNKMIRVSDEGGASISGTTVLIEKPGLYLVSGMTEEGNIVIKSSSVKLYLQNLKLSSKTTAPIIVGSNLEDVKIINIQNSVLSDLEDPLTTEGECAVIKIKKNSKVYIGNTDTLTLNGKCKNLIKGGNKVSIIFEKSDGEYILNANKTAIATDNYLEFNGGKFTIVSDFGDAIKVSPDDFDTENLGKILINDGTFDIQCYNDAFTATNNITILKGKFDIKTQNGYDSDVYDEKESSKGFKLTNNATGCEIKIYSGDFNLNTADDAFRSNRDITIVSGTYLIYSRDDAICAKFNLVLGKKDAPLDELNIKILNSYEAIEGMTVLILSGKIIATAKDDGINASGVIRKQRTRRNRSRGWNDTESRNHSRNWNDTDRPHRNDTQPGEKKKHIGAPPNDSYCISIYDGEIYIYTDSDGIDSNGNLYIHGGNINIFSEGRGANEPIDHNGNFTLFNAEVLGVGTEGLEAVHEGIKLGNQMYAYHFGVITKNKLLEIQNEKNEVIKGGSITKDINYIFYSSPKLNEDYRFYLYDEINGNKTKLNVTFNYPENGIDNEDYLLSYEEIYGNKEK